jgi:ABC-type multidrug transport system fused ATPase/permease subunit
VRQARPYWPHLIGIFLLSFLSTPFALLSPLALKIAVDSVLDNHPLPRFLNDRLPSGLTQSPNGLLVLAVALLVGVALLTCSDFLFPTTTLKARLIRPTAFRMTRLPCKRSSLMAWSRFSLLRSRSYR